MSGLSIVGRDKYGVFPLKGKLLNVRDASAKSIMQNAEVYRMFGCNTACMTEHTHSLSGDSIEANHRTETGDDLRRY
jgi:DNA gyrase/topoisomerase IV subunit B